MPPKRPLNPHERKVKKRKHELIHKAQVKRNYSKQLGKQDFDQDTPDYVKEIFGARTIDDDGNIVEYSSGRDDAPSDEKEGGRVFYLDDTDSDESDQEQASKKSKKGAQKSEKQRKPNPFKAQIQQQEEKRKLTKQERERRQRERDEREYDKKKYYQQRGRDRGRLMAKTKKGQPNMAAQVDHLLSKIQKDN